MTCVQANTIININLLPNVNMYYYVTCTHKNIKNITFEIMNIFAIQNKILNTEIIHQVPKFINKYNALTYF